MKNFERKLILLLLSVVMLVPVRGQVTTSGINGRITDLQKNEPLVGATVIAVHTPSGTQYGAVTDKKGMYRIPNARIGGPYRLTFNMLGYTPVQKEDIHLVLGENFVLNVGMKEEAFKMDQVVVTASDSRSSMNSERSGTSTNVNSRQIAVMPTISRSIDDFTRLTPQSSGSSFAGQNSRYNSVTVDGAAFNNNFGIGKNLPGGDAQPISLDAIEEISVNIAPFDVRQSSFTGASINAVTRSGDNLFRGSAYSFIRPKSFTGSKVDDKEVTGANDRDKYIYGARLGGPIVKNRLFFFVSGEYEKSNYPGLNWSASEDGTAVPDANISRVKLSDLQAMSQYLQSEYGYDPGSYGTPRSFVSDNYKLLARLDWNINANHKLTLRYNQVKSKNETQPSGSSPGLPYLQESDLVWGRYNDVGMTYHNTGYNTTNRVKSVTGELNSIFGVKVANKLLVTYTSINDKRGSDSREFPFVDICRPLDESDPNGANRHYMSFGYELYTYGNEVKNNTLTVADNLNFFLGNHSLTFGLSYDYMTFSNCFMQYGTSYYRYRSLEDFYQKKSPSMFALSYALDGSDKAAADLSFGTGAVYLQDEFQVSDRLRLTGGIRLEKVFYLNDLRPNAQIMERTFADLSGNPEKLDVSRWPKGQVSVSPRLGFNWDVYGNRSMILRGGTGIFSGRIPFVWMVNQPGNSGTLQTTAIITDADKLERLKFNPDWRSVVKNNPDLFPTDAVVSSCIAATDKHFKMPMDWRTTLAVDVKLPWHMVFTLEGIYSKNINAVSQRNANQPLPTGQFAGKDNRPKFESGKSTIYKDLSEGAFVMYNLHKGHYGSLTAQLTRNFAQGFSGMVAYTYSVSKEGAPMSGTRPNEPWKNSYAVGTLNESGISYSANSIPHRLIASISYRKEYLKHLATTVSVFYEGMTQGRFSYAYSNDMNGDGVVADLLYVPGTKDELRFTDVTDNTGKVVMSEQAQRDAFWNYVEGNDYLSSRKGKYTERNGGTLPWVHRFDVKLAQDILMNFGKDRRQSLQFTVDFLNIGNLLNSKWGVQRTTTNAVKPLTYVRSDDDGTPVYRLNAASLDKFSPEVHRSDISTSSTWGCQIGLRYSF